MIKNRSPVLAGLLSLLCPGVGHVYAGAPKKGLALIAILFGVMLLGGFLGILSTFYGFVALIVLLVGYPIFVIGSSVKLALRNKEYHLKPYNRWYWYLLIFVAVSLIANVLLPFRGSILGYESYRTAAASMEPTLQVGDFFIVNTRYSQPKVGDVVVFLYPEDRNIPYVKRVVALGNDTVSLENGIVIRNGKADGTLSIPESGRQRDYSKSMPKRHIPENEIFLLGDWRDNSKDSRFWGTVPTTDIVGKVTYVWYSKDTRRIGARVE